MTSAGDIFGSIGELMGLDAFVCSDKKCSWETNCDKWMKKNNNKCKGCQNGRPVLTCDGGDEDLWSPEQVQYCHDIHTKNRKDNAYDSCFGCKDAIEDTGCDWECSYGDWGEIGKCSNGAKEDCALSDTIADSFAILSYKGFYMGTALITEGLVKYCHPNIYASVPGAKKIGTLVDPKTLQKLSKWILKVSKRRVEVLEKQCLLDLQLIEEKKAEVDAQVAEEKKNRQELVQLKKAVDGLKEAEL